MNPLGAEDIDDEGADGPAFTPAECEAVANWVNGGGSVLLIADPGHFAAAAEILASKLEVEMQQGPHHRSGEIQTKNQMTRPL